MDFLKVHDSVFFFFLFFSFCLDFLFCFFSSHLVCDPHSLVVGGRKMDDAARVPASTPNTARKDGEGADEERLAPESELRAAGSFPRRAVVQVFDDGAVPKDYKPGKSISNTDNTSTLLCEWYNVHPSTSACLPEYLRTTLFFAPNNLCSDRRASQAGHSN